MGWPVGHNASDFDLRWIAGEGLVAGGVLVTDAQGWLPLPRPMDMPRDASAQPIAVQLRIDDAAAGGARRLVVEELQVGPRRYRSLHSLAIAQGAGWIPYVAQTVGEAIRHRLWARDVLAALALDSRAPASPRTVHGETPPVRVSEVRPAAGAALAPAAERSAAAERARKR